MRTNVDPFFVFLDHIVDHHFDNEPPDPWRRQLVRSFREKLSGQANRQSRQPGLVLVSELL